MQNETTDAPIDEIFELEKEAETTKPAGFTLKPSFIEFYKQYARYSTDAPEQYAEIIAIQLLGHAMGYKPINLIQPTAVRHNSYVLLVGESTISRKTTSQELGKDIYPYDRCLPTELSPEQLVVEMSEAPERFQWLGEFTGLLKGITSRGYMTRLVELYNDLHGCPTVYSRKLREKKAEKSEFIVKNAYLSVNSTVTPKMLQEHLTTELMEGGFLSRWLIVNGEARPKPRKRLHEKTLPLKEICQNIIYAIVNIKDKEANFIFTDDALQLYNQIEAEAYKKYSTILPFVGRYLNYLVSFADIMLLDDVIGVAIENAIDLHTINELTKLIQFTQFTQLTKENNIGNRVNSVNRVNYATGGATVNCVVNRVNREKCFFVSKEHVQRAWKVLEPCLKYVATLVDYVELDKPTARLIEYLKRVKIASHSEVMRHTHLNARQMELAISTLQHRQQIEIIKEEFNRKQGSISRGSIFRISYKWVGD
jgi:hypothetical protein